MSASDDEIRTAVHEILGDAQPHPGQWAALRALTEGRDTLVVLPSGAGKSAVYQAAGALSGGVVVVVSPLVALQRDQVLALRALGHRAAALDATVSARRRAEIFADLRGEGTRFVFLAPEQLERPDVMDALHAAAPTLFVVDEAHCISAWGHDFRPDYLRLGSAIDAIGHPVTAALTATAAPPVRGEITARLGMRDPVEVVRGFDRPNIALDVRHHHDADTKRAAVVREVADAAKPGILYVATRKETEYYADALARCGVDAAAYHAGLPRSERDRLQQAFMDGGLAVMAATNAFGMGLDKADVRHVVHADVPGSPDSYYQEVGRSGRDGEPARAVLFFRADDLRLQRFFTGGRPDGDLLAAAVARVRAAGRISRKELRADLDVPARRLTTALSLLEQVGAVRARSRRDVLPGSAGQSAEAAAREAVELAERHRDVERTRLEMMREYAETSDCRGRFLLGYLGEPHEEPCGHCDNCAAGRSESRPPRGVRFAAKTRVRHPDWGRGTVLRRGPDRLVVLFDEHGYRELDLATVAERELLQETAQAAD